MLLVDTRTCALQDLLAGVVAVNEQQPERDEHKEHDENVQQARARMNEMLPVSRQQQGSRGTQPHRTEHADGNAGDDHNADGADERCRKAPAKRIGAVAEKQLTGPENPFAQRRMDNIRRVIAQRREIAGGEFAVGVLSPFEFDPVMGNRVGVLDVIGFVKNEFARMVQAQHAQKSADSGDQQRPHPAPHGRQRRGLRHSRAQPG